MKVLFIPSSGTKGSGETLNAFQIFQFLNQNHVEIEAKIVLNESSPFVDNSPIPVKITNDTPTRCNERVVSIIKEFKPDISFFLGAGSKQQFKYSKRHGAVNIFISFSENLRNRGLRLGRVQHIDLHIVDQYDFLLNDLNFFEKIKTLIWKNSTPLYLGPIFNLPSTEEVEKTLLKYHLKQNDFILISSGSGAECDLNGMNYSSSIFKSLQNKNFPFTIVQSFGKAYPKTLPPSSKGYMCIKYLEPNEFICLVKAAKLIVTNGGGSLLQAISLNKASLSCPMVDDQFKRVQICSSLKLTTPFDPSNIDIQIKQSIQNLSSKKQIEVPKSSALQKINELIVEKLK